MQFYSLLTMKSNKKTMPKLVCGFTLLEVLIVMGIVAVLAAAGSGFYANYNKNVEIKSLSQTIIFDLKQAQAKSMDGVGGFKWGIHFVNPPSGLDYYEIFSTPTDYSAKVIDTTKYLSSGITFFDPISNSTKDIIFNKISGGATASSVSLLSQNTMKTIYVFGLGNITDNPTCSTYSVTGPDTLTYGTVLGEDGKCWLDRNLGATRVATAYNDASSYGHYYQWGRGVDGHQIKTSGTTSTLSTTNIPGHSNFILSPSSPFDWRSPQNDNLWQGINGINNPCPSGFRLPTTTEIQTLATAIPNFTTATCGGSTTCRDVAFNSILKIPSAGSRDYSSASLNNLGNFGLYWSSSSGVYVYNLYFNSSAVSPASTDYRAYGFSVRCIKD